jgi:hypothetical protein
MPKPRTADVPTPTLAPRAGQSLERWRLTVFDAATVFPVVTVLGGRAPRGRWELSDPVAALRLAAATPRSMAYAVAPAGRSIPLERRLWGFWLRRWDLLHPLTSRTGDHLMSIFLLSWPANHVADVAVHRFESRPLAEAYSFDALPDDHKAFVVESVADLGDRTIFSGPVLVTLYNALNQAMPYLTRFESLDHARERVARVLLDKHGEDPLTQQTPATELPDYVSPTQEAAAKAKPAAEPKPPKAPKAPKAPATRGARALAPEVLVYLLTGGANPKTPGKKNHERFAGMMGAMTGNVCTVKQAIEAGATMGDLLYDVEHGFLRVEAPVA